ncbi:hypothetical protein COB55_04020 [Candidatus Wolfebacteria bacterium]|nr:MAG: hypothetical protein COB55_04020 [Candidatus Wolfebacteria bacterium]
MTSFEQTITDLQELRKIDYELGAKLENSKDSNEVLISLNRKQADDIKELEDNLVSDEVTFKWQAERIKELEAHAEYYKGDSNQKGGVITRQGGRIKELEDSLSDSKVTNSSQKSHINKILGDLDDANQHRDQSLGALSNRDATIRQLKRDLSDKVSQLEGQRDTLLDCQTDYRKCIKELEAQLSAGAGTASQLDIDKLEEEASRRLRIHDADQDALRGLQGYLTISNERVGQLEADLQESYKKTYASNYNELRKSEVRIKELEATIGGLQVNVKGLGAMIKSQADFIGEQQQTIDEQRVDLRTLKGKLVEFGPIKSTNQQDNC